MFSFHKIKEGPVQLIDKRALKDLTLSIASIKFTSIAFYVGLYFGALWYAKGWAYYFLQITTLAIIPLQFASAGLLFWGVLEDNITLLVYGLWTTIVIATYNMLIGTIGCLYFIHANPYAIYFIIAVFYLLLATSAFPVIFIYITIIQALIKTMRCSDPTGPCKSSCEVKLLNV